VPPCWAASRGAGSGTQSVKKPQLQWPRDLHGWPWMVDLDNNLAWFNNIRFPRLNLESDHLHLSYHDLQPIFGAFNVASQILNPYRFDRDVFSTRSTGGRTDGANTTLGAAVDPTFRPRPRQLHFAVPLGPPHLMSWGVNAKIHIWLTLFMCPLTMLVCTLCTPKVSLEMDDAENASTDWQSSR